MIAALAGGVGSARFLAGCSQVVDPRDVVIVGNTGDDDWFHGLRVCPDLDSVTYALAGRQQPRDRLGPRGRDLRDPRRPRPLRRAHLVRPRRPRLRHPPFRTERLRAGDAAVGGHRRHRRRLGPRVPPAPDDRRRASPPGSPRRAATGTSSSRWRSGSCGSAASPRCSRALRRRRRGAPGPGVLDALARRRHHRRSARRTRSLSIAPILAVPGVRDGGRRARDASSASATSSPAPR